MILSLHKAMNNLVENIVDWLRHYDVIGNRNDLSFPHKNFDRYIIPKDDGTFILRKIFYIAGYDNLIYTYSNRGVVEITMRKSSKAYPPISRNYNSYIDLSEYNVTNSRIKDELRFIVKFPFFVDKPNITVENSDGIVIVDARIVESDPLVTATVRLDESRIV